MADTTVITVLDPKTFVKAAKFVNLEKIDLNGVLRYKGQSITNQHSLTTNAAFVETIVKQMANMPEKGSTSRSNGSVVLACEILSFEMADAKVRNTRTNVIKEIDGVKTVVDTIQQPKVAGTKSDGTKSFEEQRIIAKFKMPGGETFTGNFPAEVGVLAAQTASDTINILFEASHSENPRFPINVWANPA